MHSVPGCIPPAVAEALMLTIIVLSVSGLGFLFGRLSR